MQACNTSQSPEQTRLPRRGHSGGVRRVPVTQFNSGRKRFVRIRVNDEEHATLTRLGKSEGGVSALVRRHLLGQGVTDARREALRELARLARGFNSIAIGTQRFDPARAVEVIAWLVIMERELNGAIQRLSTKRPVC